MASVAKKRSSATAGNDDGPSKKVKTGAVKNSTIGNPYQTRTTAASKVDANGDRYWEISKMRRVTVSSFRGKTMVNIREYYEKDGRELPGKKGISMPMDQFATFITLLPEIEAVLKENGENTPRPVYTGLSNPPYESDGDEASPSGNSKDVASRKNIDATSEEEEEDGEEVE